jgi:hypothetical protein
MDTPALVMPSLNEPAALAGVVATPFPESPARVRSQVRASSGTD